WGASNGVYRRTAIHASEVWRLMAIHESDKVWRPLAIHGSDSVWRRMVVHVSDSLCRWVMIVAPRPATSSAPTAPITMRRRARIAWAGRLEGARGGCLVGSDLVPPSSQGVSDGATLHAEQRS